MIKLAYYSVQSHSYNSAEINTKLKFILKLHFGVPTILIFCFTTCFNKQFALTNSVFE